MKLKNVIKLLLLVAILAAVGSWYYFEVYRRQPITIEEDGGIVINETELLNETLTSGLKNMGEMITAEYYFTSSETVQDVKVLDLTSLGINFKTDIPLTGHSFTYSYDGEIMAGIDFRDVEVRVDGENKTVTVNIPGAGIISSSIDPDSCKFYEIKNNILNPISPEDYALSLADLIHSEETKAVDKGLLEKANKNAKELIANFIKSYAEGYRVTVNTK